MTTTRKLTDQYLEDRAQFDTSVGDMARELLAHRRASQAAPAPSDALREALEWYADTVRKCRMIHREGDEARTALDADGGRRARAALSTPTEECQ